MVTRIECELCTGPRGEACASIVAHEVDVIKRVQENLANTDNLDLELDESRELVLTRYTVLSDALGAIGCALDIKEVKSKLFIGIAS